jgi:CheY-like chemotaxis protein
MDLFMPKHDGFTAAKKIHQTTESREIPIVAVSAYGELGITEQLRQQAHRTGFVEYVEKPYEPSKLLTLIEHLLSPSPG